MHRIGAEPAALAPDAPPGKVRVFVSFDLEHDADLCDLLLDQSVRSISGFEISGRSEGRTVTGLWAESVRRRMREVDEVIVICGELTEESACMSAELRIAREERRPYFLLWGRRGSMCTRPAGARSDDGMFAWTREILDSQISSALRRGRFRGGAKGSSARAAARKA